MSELRFVNFIVAKDLIQAEMIQNLLRANNIPCVIRDRGQTEVLDGAATAMTGGVILRVPENQLKQAKEVLEMARESGKQLDDITEADEEK